MTQRIEPVFDFNKETCITKCILTDSKNNTYIGEAFCHPDDKDMLSEYTGCEIAYHRALIAQLKEIRDKDLLPSLKALTHLYSCMEQASNFNPKDNNVRLTKRAIDNYQASLDACRDYIKSERDGLHSYITKKEKIFKRIRDKAISDKINQ